MDNIFWKGRGSVPSSNSNTIKLSPNDSFIIDIGKISDCLFVNSNHQANVKGGNSVSEFMPVLLWGEIYAEFNSIDKLDKVNLP